MYIFIRKLSFFLIGADCLTHNMKERQREIGEKVVEPPTKYNMIMVMSPGWCLVSSCYEVQIIYQPM